ncbi:hypothetical protein [Caballeronia glathei]|nr:hypothetical protein [Caballeronia glathei]
MTEREDSAKNSSFSPIALYANANEAWSALEEMNLFEIGIIEEEPIFDPHQIAAAISEDVAAIKPDWDKLHSVSTLVHRLCEGDDVALVQKALNDFLERNWEALAVQARKYAFDRFQQKHSADRVGFDEALDRWQVLTNDPILHRQMVEKFTEGKPSNRELNQLKLVRGTFETARAVLEHAWKYDLEGELLKHQSLSGAMGAILRDSAGHTRWGQLQALLWLKRGDADEVSAFERGLGQHVLEVAELLDEFGILRQRSAHYQLSYLSPQSRESWRRQLRRAVGGDIELRNAVVELLFLYGEAGNDREVLFAAARLQGPESEPYLNQLRRHSDRFVRRRATALLDLMSSVPDIIEQELLKSATREDELSRRSVRPRPTRTWIGDDRIENLIEQTVNDVARKYSNDISPTRSSGEETHVAILFDRISQALAIVSSRLEELARQHDEYEYLRIHLTHRIVGKTEEGGPGTDGAKRLSTDICILFTGRDREKLFAQRVSLLQAKRITRDVDQASDRYSIDRSQLEDLARQTMAGFLATLGPCHADVSIPIIPARLMLDMIERGEPSTVLYPGRAAELGKSIGTWLLEDVIGLWTGDWNNNVIDVAKGGVFRRPYMLVEIVAERLQLNN